MFQIRNRRHFIIGTFTENEIISKIATGKYQGDEEVSTDPFHVWQKISSHPTFYDAFLRRIFVNNYQAPETLVSAVPNSTKNSKLSARSNLPKPDQSVIIDKGQATQQLSTKQHLSEGSFNQNEEIERLFEEPVSDSDPEADISANIEDVFQEEDNLLERESLSPGGDIQLADNTTQQGALFFEEEISDISRAPEKSSNRKRLIAATIGLSLVVLYQMGQTGPVKDSSKPENLSAKEDELISADRPLNPLNREEIVAAFSEEAVHFYELDTPLHYKGALGLFKDAAELRSDDSQILGLKILSQAHLFEQEPNNTKLEEDTRELIARGRKSEPQLNAFYRAEALMEYFKKNNDVALEKIRNAIEADPSDLESQILEAEFLNTMGDRIQAKTKIERVLAAGSKLVRGYSVAAQIALDTGDLTAAELFARKALQINQLHANTHFIIAEVYQRQGNKGAAIAHLDLVTKLAPLASRPILADAHFSLAKLVEEQGNLNEATKHNKLAYFFSGGSLPGLRAKILGDKSDTEELKLLAKEQQYDVGFYNLRADELINENQLILGLEYLQAVRLLEPDKPEPLIRVADVLERLAVSYEKLKRVELLYERAIRTDPSYLDSYIRLGAIETEQYNYENAYKLFLKASKVIGIEDLSSFVDRGCQEKREFASTAKDDYKVYLALGKHFFKRESYDCAATFFQQAQKSSPVNSDVNYYFGRLSELYKPDEPQRVINYYYQAFTIDSSNYEALAGWARMKTKVGDKNYVIKYLRALTEVDPRNYNLFWVLGETYAENQEYQRAVNFYKKALDYNPRFSKGRISLARALSAVGQIYQAVNEFTYAATSDRRNVVGFFEAAQLQAINKKYPDAELLIKALLEATPNYPGAHRLLSQIYQFMGKKDEAISEMVIETQNNPQNTKFRIDLAEIYIKYLKYDDAIQELTKVVNHPGESKAPAFRADRTQAFLLMSRSMRALNRPDNAEGAIKLALEIDKDDPELHRELGYVYHDLQRWREGVKEFEIYLQRKPAGSDVDNIKGLIKKMIIEE